MSICRSTGAFIVAINLDGLGEFALQEFKERIYPKMVYS